MNGIPIHRIESIIHMHTKCMLEFIPKTSCDGFHLKLQFYIFAPSCSNTPSSWIYSRKRVKPLTIQNNIVETLYGKNNSVNVNVFVFVSLIVTNIWIHSVTKYVHTLKFKSENNKLNNIFVEFEARADTNALERLL